MPEFTHLDSSGNPKMVDISAKQLTKRTAKARAIVYLPDEIYTQLNQQGEINVPKGAVFQTAILAGIMAAKKTGELIPLCHPLGLDNCQIEVVAKGQGEIWVYCQTSVTGKTGVEMEALTGASLAALTIYDMCKAFSSNIIIRELRLIEKTGGKKDYYHHD